MYIQNRNRFTDIENKLVIIGEREGGGAMGLRDTNYSV